MEDRHWSLSDIPWDRFDASLVEPAALDIIKAASLVERNATDYVAYLCNVFADDQAFQASILRWGEEEEQHGEALGRWAELADPTFHFHERYRQFRARYQIPIDVTGSVRGSRAGEMVARCIVESGTSSFYSALRDGSREPVLRFICARIAGDEVRHYVMFHKHLQACPDNKQLGLVGRARVAWTRLHEADDDELAIAYHCANMDPQPYDRGTASRAYAVRASRFYLQKHVRGVTRMILKAVGIKPPSRVSSVLAWLAWTHLQRRWNVG
ncbi:MAG: ferritin-like domain-containing protein [Rhodospirillales bacterium]